MELKRWQQKELVQSLRLSNSIDEIVSFKRGTIEVDYEVPRQRSIVDNKRLRAFESRLVPKLFN